MITQKRIEAKGDVAGRDIKNTVTVVHHPPISSSYDIIVKLFDDFEEDKIVEQISDKIIEELKSYGDLDDVENNSKDLTKKLTDATRQDLIKIAIKYKEIFRQRVEKYRLYASAQAIYAHLLGHVLSRFHTYVQTAISQDKSHAEIAVILQEMVVDPIVKTIPAAEPTCDHPTIFGMVYFLTGNCFIDWQK